MPKKKLKQVVQERKQSLSGSPSVGAGRNRRWGVWVSRGVAVLAVLAAAVGIFMASSPSAPAQRLVGRWLRPDGGYVLDIRAAKAGGQMEAAYFNPRSIHVAQANYRSDSRDLAVFIELQDLNYPGSTYSLRYLPKEDKLVGEYFQALQRQTFDVEFVRSN